MTASVTQVLSRVEPGDSQAAAQLLPLVYDELRKLAAVRLAQERSGQTLQATALVHDAYIRLVDTDSAQPWESRGHFFAAAAEAMRRILIERARQKLSLKGGGGFSRVDLGQAQLTLDPDPDKLLVLDEAIEKLSREDAQGAELAKLRLFAGLSVEEAAASLGISRTTAFRNWIYARAYLQAELLPE